MPLVADSLLTSLDLLARACLLLADRCIDGIVADRARCQAHVAGATATATALVGRLGYHRAQEAASIARHESQELRAVVVGRGLLSPEEFDSLVSPEAVMRLGSPADSPATNHDRGSVQSVS